MVWLVKSTHRRRGCRAPRSRSSGRLSDYGRNLTPVRACSDKSPAIPRNPESQPGSFAEVRPSLESRLQADKPAAQPPTAQFRPKPYRNHTAHPSTNPKRQFWSCAIL